MDKIKKDKNNNILNFYSFSNFTFTFTKKKRYFYFSFDFYQKSLFNFDSTYGPFPMVQKSLFKLTFDFDLFPSALVVITCGTFFILKVHHHKLRELLMLLPHTLCDT